MSGYGAVNSHTGPAPALHPQETPWTLPFVFPEMWAPTSPISSYTSSLFPAPTSA